MSDFGSWRSDQWSVRHALGRGRPVLESETLDLGFEMSDWKSERSN